MSYFAGKAGGALVTNTKLDFLLNELWKRSDLINRAHLELGIPLEDCISSTVRLAVKQLEANPDQLELFWQKRKEEEKS
jgi:hypothetical protein